MIAYRAVGKAGLNLFLSRAVTRKRAMPGPRADGVGVWDVCHGVAQTFFNARMCAATTMLFAKSVG